MEQVVVEVGPVQFVVEPVHVVEEQVQPQVGFSHFYEPAWPRTSSCSQ